MGHSVVPGHEIHLDLIFHVVQMLLILPQRDPQFGRENSHFSEKMEVYHVVKFTHFSEMQG